MRTSYKHICNPHTAGEEQFHASIPPRFRFASSNIRYIFHAPCIRRFPPQQLLAVPALIPPQIPRRPTSRHLASFHSSARHKATHAYRETSSTVEEKLRPSGLSPPSEALIGALSAARLQTYVPEHFLQRMLSQTVASGFGIGFGVPHLNEAFRVSRENERILRVDCHACQAGLLPACSPVNATPHLHRILSQLKLSYKSKRRASRRQPIGRMSHPLPSVGNPNSPTSQIVVRGRSE